MNWRTSRAAAAVLGAVGVELLLHVGHREDGVDVAVDLVGDRRRQLARADQAVPGGRLEAGEALLLHRRHGRVALGALARASARSPSTLPFFTCGVAAVMVSKLYWIWPPIRSVSSGPLPLYGTCSASTPACSLNISSARCCAEPGPAEPKVTWPGSPCTARRCRARSCLLRRVGDQQVGRDADQHDRHEVASRRCSAASAAGWARARGC